MRLFNGRNYVTRQKGFTMIEMMVTLVIIGVATSLVGGMLVETVAKQERLVEVEKVKHVFKQLSYKAFYSGADIDVVLAENTMQVSAKGLSKQIVFNQLDFDTQHFIVSTGATISPNNFSVNWNDDDRIFDIPSLFPPFDG